MSLCHTCDNPRCVNPNHLYVGTHAQNMRDKAIRGRHNPAKGERNRSAKLTECEVITIRGSSDAPGELALRYGLTLQGIRAIQLRKVWKHVAA